MRTSLSFARTCRRSRSKTSRPAFRGIVTEGGGRITKVEHWGLRTLAYKIKKNRKGHYVLMNVDAPPDAVKEMERNMRLSEDVLRLMTIRVDELEEGPSAMMRNRGSRDERGRGGDRPRRDSRGGEGRDRPAASAPAASAPAVSAPADAAPGAESAPEKAEATAGRSRSRGHNKF